MPHRTSHGSAVPPGRRRARLGLGALAAAGLLGGLLAAPAVSAAPTGPLAELITNGDFSGRNHEPWWFTENSPASVVDGQLCAEVPADTEEVRDAIVGQDGVSLVEGEEYTLTYTVSATARHTITTHVQEAVDPWGPSSAPRTRSPPAPGPTATPSPHRPTTPRPSSSSRSAAARGPTPSASTTSR
ncbi:carbohydrate binding domain-containing protein [Streptomyces sp. TRM 70361]|uniref:carbohydrate binding domain-containing protein n=1 Tax=Streptomyces sp. TRM 70361 TaxID=3116553 RepID=UPI002E7B640F|nr:carbohydrate binding domain-containing protein [Streptomyces sp. TRM 70361]MEE1941238.1 carbohydrate binding domain-containing protein [Streptomyces sp. TRM 70361]